MTAEERGLDPDHRSVTSAQCEYYGLEETVCKTKDLFKQ